MNFIPSYKNSFRILKGGKISLVVSSFLAGTTLSFAAPSGGVVTSGDANISQAGKVTNISQSTQKASINWNKFDIASDETVNFKQPNSSSITLNRVVGNERSVINGALNANGQVWILNSNGVLFGKNASINTAGLLATTKELSDTDFQAGNYNFKGDSTASVINLGEIDISDSGYATLLANTVSNEGTIKAVKGQVHLVGANEVTINFNGNSIVDLTVNKGILDALVENKGAIYADGGEIYLTTNAVDELLKGVVNNTGIIEANSFEGVTGHVELFAHGGEAKMGGTVTALEGFVETSGDKVKINDDFRVKADKWLIDPKDFTIAASGGDITGATLSSNLEGASVEIKSIDGATDGNGDIFVNDAISWDAETGLTLNAQNNIYINDTITSTNGGLVLFYGQATANGGTSDYYIKAKVNLKAGNTSFFTRKGSDGSNFKGWTVITHDNLATAITTGGLGHNYVLGSDLDLSGIANWTPIGNSTTKFTGNFDGLGHTINALKINRPTENNIGLFGYTNGATIKNIGVTNVNITGGDNAYIGGLVGFSNNSIVSNSYSTGSVTGGVNAKVGGLVGRNSNASTVSNSYSTASVTGGSGALLGGLVGHNYFSTVSNSYSSGSVTSNINYAYAGGLVGVNSNASTVSNSYSTASVTGGTGSILGGLVGFNSSSTINNSYYDKTLVTGMADESSYGKTTTELRDLAAQNWDIETYSATENTYPTLAWQESGNTYTKTWVMGTKVATPDPVDPKPDPVDPKPEIKKIVDSITNQSAITINLPNVEANTTPNNIGKNVNIIFVQGENQMLVSRPIEGQSTQRVSLSEARQIQIQNGGSGEEVIVPLSNSSIIQLIDGGVNLPSGVEQEFYLANANTQEEK